MPTKITVETHWERSVEIFPPSPKKGDVLLEISSVKWDLNGDHICDSNDF